MHLRVHSAYSLLEGALTIPKLVGACRRQGMPALALTDTNNLFGALEFSEDAGRRPASSRSSAARSRLSFAAEPEARPDSGELVDARQSRPHRAPRQGRERLRQSHAALDRGLSLRRRQRRGDGHDRSPGSPPAEGLIALTGGPDGVIDRALAANDFRFAEARARMRCKAFSATGSMSSCSATACRRRGRSSRFCSISLTTLDLPIVATNEPYFAQPRRFRGA